MVLDISSGVHVSALGREGRPTTTGIRAPRTGFVGAKCSETAYSKRAERVTLIRVTVERANPSASRPASRSCTSDAVIVDTGRRSHVEGTWRRLSESVRHVCGETRVCRALRNRVINPATGSSDKEGDGIPPSERTRYCSFSQAWASAFRSKDRVPTTTWSRKTRTRYLPDGRLSIAITASPHGNPSAPRRPLAGTDVCAA